MLLPSLVLACLLAIPAGERADAEAAYLLSRSLLESGREGDLERAQDLAELSVRLAPGVARYHHQLGTAWAREAMEGKFAAFRLAGRIERALERAVALEPSWILARQSLLGFRLLAPGWLGGSVERAAEQARAIERLDPLLGQMAWMAVHHAREAWPAFERAALTAAPLAIGRGHRRQLLTLLEAAGYPVEDDRSFGPLWLVSLPPRRPAAASTTADAWAASERGYDQALALADAHVVPSEAPEVVASAEPDRDVPKPRPKAKRRATVP